MSTEKGKLYIAYGSNLNLRQMKHRCPTAEVVGKSEIKDFQIVFRGHDHGVATIEHCVGKSVPVLVWRIYPKDEKALDIYEGVPHLYHKETIHVELNGMMVEGLIYIMNEGFRAIHPSYSYMNIIRAGYEEAGFDKTDLRIAARRKEDRIMTEKIRAQIMAIRDSGETNMLDASMVQCIANREGYYELVCFIEDHRKEYVHFIFTGEES